MASERVFEQSAVEEDRDADGRPRPGYDWLLDALAGADLVALGAAVAEHLDRLGVSFGGAPFVVDPVPRLLARAEWDDLAAGLAQRTRALNRFLRDAYGGRRIVAAGIVAAEDIDAAEGLEPDLLGGLPGHAAPAAIIGFDVVRGADGEFLVLEDNARTPSGFAYAIAARRAVRALLPAGAPEAVPVDPATFEMLASTLRAAAPAGVERAAIVVLTDGPANVAYYEHARAAGALGVPLVTLDRLDTDGRSLVWRDDAGAAHRVDVLYRRSDEDRIRDERGRMTPVAEVLVPPWRAGRLGLVNAFGNGLADDKLIHRHVEDFVRFYLEEEPLVGSVPTDTFASAALDGDLVASLRERVVKPRRGHGGHGVVVGPHAEEADLIRLAEDVRAHPGRYISQPPVALSRHPTVIGGRLEPRHVDLRAFAFAGETVSVMPGGLSRVALEAGALVVNTSQRGGGKDTWVLA